MVKIYRIWKLNFRQLYVNAKCFMFTINQLNNKSKLFVKFNQCMVSLGQAHAALTFYFSISKWMHSIISVFYIYQLLEVLCIAPRLSWIMFSTFCPLHHFLFIYIFLFFSINWCTYHSLSTNIKGSFKTLHFIANF